jgi:hypothetical protein
MIYVMSTGSISATMADTGAQVEERLLTFGFPM